MCKGGVCAQVLQSKVLLARDLMSQYPINTELLKEVTEASNVTAFHALDRAVAKGLLSKQCPILKFQAELLCLSFGFFEFGWPAQDLRTEVRDIVKRKARFCKLVLDLNLRLRHCRMIHDPIYLLGGRGGV